MYQTILAVSIDPSLNPLEMEKTLNQKFSRNTEVPRYPYADTGMFRSLMEDAEKHFLYDVRKYINLPDKKSRQAKDMKKGLAAIVNGDVKKFIKFCYGGTYTVKGNTVYTTENPDGLFDHCTYKPFECGIETKEGFSSARCSIKEVSLERIKKIGGYTTYFYDWDKDELLFPSQGIKLKNGQETLTDIFKKYLEKRHDTSVYVFEIHY